MGSRTVCLECLLLAFQGFLGLWPRAASAAMLPPIAKRTVPFAAPVNDPTPKEVRRFRTVAEARSLASGDFRLPGPRFPDARTRPNGVSVGNANNWNGRFWLAAVADGLDPADGVSASFQTSALSNAGPGFVNGVTVTATIVVRAMRRDEGMLMRPLILVYRNGTMLDLDNPVLEILAPGTYTYTTAGFSMAPGDRYHARGGVIIGGPRETPAGRVALVNDAEVTSIRFNF